VRLRKKFDEMALNARAKTVAAETLRMDNKYLPPQAPNPERAVADLAAMQADSRDRADGAKTGKFPLSALHTGHYIQDDDRTTYYKAHEDVVAATGKRFGEHFAPPGLTEYFLDKKDKELYFNQLKFAEYLADSSRPDTQEHLYSIFPELKERPEEYYRQEIALQWTLKSILAAGKIKSKADFMLIAHVVRPDFMIPVYPAWDPTGIFIRGTKSYADLITRGMKRGLLNPLRYADGPDNTDNLAPGSAQNQRELKRAIVRRLFDGLRMASNNEIDNAIQRTVMTGKADGSGSIYREPMRDGYAWMWDDNGKARTLNSDPYSDGDRLNATAPGVEGYRGNAERYNPAYSSNPRVVPEPPARV
jgi:hypothetical protein